MNKDGIMLVDKPTGMTSHDVVDFIRDQLKIRRVGHAGILDPAATGLLIILIGKGTKFSSFMIDMSKIYVGRFVFGVATDTYDLEGKVISQSDPGNVTRDEFEKLLKYYTGEIEQIIPPYSAAKRGGIPSYKLARKGKDIDPGRKVVRIDSIEIVEFAWPEVALKISCSAGTYVRSMAHQLGQTIGCGGHLKALRRLSIGNFGIASASTLEEIQNCVDIGSLIKPLKHALPSSPAIFIKPQYYGSVLNGRPFMKKFIALGNYRGKGDELSILMGPDEKVLALAKLNLLWKAIDKLGPSEVMGTYVRVIDEGYLRTG
ncbi:MAG: tRNA pseudouridine(55) synthase TruB [candidate division Zixibacteria bacterium]